MAEEQKPWLIAFLALFDEFDGVLVENVGGVELALWPIDFFLASGGKAFVEIGVPLIMRVGKRVAEELIEPALYRPGFVVEMPFADVVGTVARVAECELVPVVVEG